MDQNKKRRTFWFLAVAWLALIYGTLPLVRPICDFLKIHLPFALIINLILCLALGGLFFIFFRISALRSSIARVGFILILGAYGFLFQLIVYPEEKIHFLQYGLLAFLMWKAIRIDVSHKMSYLLALILSSACGFVDEWLQDLWPNRYYQLSDVMLNLVSASLGTLLTYIFHEGQT